MDPLSEKNKEHYENIIVDLIKERVFNITKRMIYMDLIIDDTKGYIDISLNESFKMKLSKYQQKMFEDYRYYVKSISSNQN